MRERKKRGYSRAFTPRTVRRVTMTIDRVPPTLKARFKARCTALGISVRARILTLMQQDVRSTNERDKGTMRQQRYGIFWIVLLLMALLPFTAPSSAQGGYEWNHLIIGTSQDYETGKSGLATALDQLEAAGWEIRFVEARSTNPYTNAAVYDVVARGPKGLYVPQPVEPPPAPEPPPTSEPTPEPSPFGTSCPGYPNAPFAGARCYADGGWRP